VRTAKEAKETKRGKIGCPTRSSDFLNVEAAKLQLHDIYLELSAAHIAYVKFIFESYEEVGIIRTVDNEKAIIVLLAMADFLDTARNILDSIGNDIPLREIARPADMKDDWFMAELIAESSVSRS
jgi:hypothetical protein